MAAEQGHIDRSELAWLAGLLEGEGTFVVGPPSAPTVTAVRLEMCDRDVVVRAATLIRRAVIAIAPRRVGARGSFATAIRGRPATDLMLDVAPYLGPRRREQIRRCLPPPHVLPTERPELRSIAWLAGLLEGEGCFLPKHGTNWPRVSLEMTDAGTVTAAAAVMGAQHVRSVARRRVGWRATYVASVSGHRAVALMQDVRPHLGARRRAAVDRAIGSWHPVRLAPAPRTCVSVGCHAPHRARGLCHAHYMRWSRSRRAGLPATVPTLR